MFSNTSVTLVLQKYYTIVHGNNTTPFGEQYECPYILGNFCLSHKHLFYFCSSHGQNDERCRIMEKFVVSQIKLLRELSKLSQDEVSRKLKMSRSNYANLERGLIPITSEKIVLLMELYDVDANYLFNVPTKLCVCKHKYKLYMLEQRKLFKRLFK